MTLNARSALIVAAPGPLRDALYIFLRTSLGMEDIRQIGDGRSALISITASPPGLVTLDTNIPGNEFIRLIRSIKTGWPDTRCLVVADTGQEEQDAAEAGADAVILKGFLPVRLFETVQALLRDAPQQAGQTQ